MEQLGKVLKRTLVRKSTSRSTGISPGNEPAQIQGCPICSGHGWVVLDVPVEHPDFGRSFPCECRLREFASNRVQRLERYSNLGPLTRLTFDNLRPEGLDADPDKQKQFKFCYEQAKAFAGDPHGWLVLTGPSGCGKTHMAVAIANHCLRQGIAIFWTIVPDLLDHLRTTFSPTSDVSYDDLFERVKNAPMLILDDLGTHSSTPWAEEKLFQVLNHRFNAQLPTVVTTISLRDLDQRLQTRLKTPGLSRQLELRKEGPPLFNHIGGLSRDIICTMSFKTFDIQGMNADREQRESLKMALEAARQFAESPENWLVLVGPPGSGKTHLAAAIANQQITSQRPAFFASVPELLDHLPPTFGTDDRRGHEIRIEEIKNSPLLIFDDLGMETATAWAREKLYRILNYRYNARLATVITVTNPALESLDARLRSRLMDPRISNVVPIGAPDYRGQDKRAPRSRRGR
ncbi:ATP-binding protein [Dehalococcoidia bacterium]|nr:ATP-binding protein [Dehalococcoidia bacterium]